MSSEAHQKFDTLVSQAQIAHRLIVGFYQRLSPSIKQVAQQLELTFSAWEPYATNRPCTKRRDPTEYWAWDMVPMLAFSHSYLRSNGLTSEVGDLVLDLYISFDNNFSHEESEKFGIPEGQEPDATTLPMGSALVQVYLGRCDLRSDIALEQLWELADEVKEDNELIGHWQTISPNLSASYLKKTLAEFIANPESIVHEVRSLLEKPAYLA